MLTNIGLLVTAYAGGQGAIFAAQTFLVANGNLTRIAAFGSAYYFVTLATQASEFGSTTVVAREAAHSSDGPGLERLLPSVVIVRAMVALLVSVALIGTLGQSSDPFLQSYFSWATPAVLVTAFNLVGLLDGWRLTGLAGLSTAVPHVLSAIALLVTSDTTPSIAGATLGAAFAVGTTLGVALQYAAVLVARHHLPMAVPAAATIIDAFRACLAVFLSILPGQLYFRWQILLCTFALDPTATGLLIYGKQISVAASQVIGFVRRVEFPDVVALHRQASRVSILPSLRRQRLSIGTALSASFAIAVVATAVILTSTGDVRAAGLAALLFAPAVVSGSISSAMLQSYYASGRYLLPGAITTSATIVAAALAALVVFVPSIAVFAACDVAFSAIIISVIVYYTSYRQPKVAR